MVLRNPESGAEVDNELLLLDTGGDVTLLSRSAVERLGVPPETDQRYELMGFDGSRSFAPVVVLDLIFLKRIFHGRYLLVEEERGILGRDVLNHVALLLSSPATDSVHA